jgi:calcyphosin
MDDNGSGTLDQYEFTKAINDFGVKIDQKDIATLFKLFDIDGNNEIDFNEFVRMVVGPMNEFRTQICIKAFKQIDQNQDGVLSLEDIKGRYNAMFHPDVKAGKKTEDEVLKEFLETFESHYNVMHGSKSDGLVTPDEFVEYYANISANIDNDAYFELMMANVWNIDSRNNPNYMPFAGVAKKITAVNAREAYRNDHHRNLFGTDKSTPFEKKQGAGWQTTSNSHFVDSGVNPNLIKAAGSVSSDPKMSWMRDTQRSSGANYTGIVKNNSELTQMFKDKLAARGARGVLGMQRVFKVMDDNNSGTLDI